MMGLIGKPKLCAKFEIDIFSNRKNIKQTPNFWELPDEDHGHFVSFGVTL